MSLLLNKTGLYARTYLILFEFAAVIVYYRKKLPFIKKTLPVNYPLPLTDLHQTQQVLGTLQFRAEAKHYLILFEFSAVIVRHKKNYPF